MAEPCPLVSLDDLQERAEWQLDDHERTVAQARIYDASDMAREESGQSWTRENCPPRVRRMIVAAVLRIMRNPAGFIDSQSGDERGRLPYAYDDVHFTPDELDRLHDWRDAAKQRGRLAAMRTYTEYSNTHGLLPDGSPYPYRPINHPLGLAVDVVPPTGL